MLQCCGAPAPIVPILVNPVTWLVVAAAASAIYAKATGRQKK